MFDVKNLRDTLHFYFKTYTIFILEQIKLKKNDKIYSEEKFPNGKKHQ